MATSSTSSSSSATSKEEVSSAPVGAECSRSITPVSNLDPMEIDSLSTMSDSTVSSMTSSKKDKTCIVCGDRALGYNSNSISCESCKAFISRDAHKDSLSTMSDSTVSSMTSSKKDKTCLVCGDRALGYNFNAISCESCKAFFRRNAHKTIRGRCEGKCEVTIESRSFCKRCRQAKCFSVGMRRDMILNDHQKKARKQKIIINKLRRQGHMPPEDTYSVGPGDLPLWSKSQPDSQLISVKQENSNSPSSCSFPTSPEPIKYPAWAESQNVVKAAIESLNDRHRLVLEELLHAHEVSCFLTGTSTSLKMNPSNPEEFVNIAEGFVRRIIKVAKNIESFKKLVKDDQICLLKGAVVDVMMLRSAVNYDPQTESWSLSTVNCIKPDVTGAASPSTSNTTAESSRISASILKSGNAETQHLFMTYSKFIKSLMTTIHGDLLILKVLIMMSLYSADRGELVNRHMVHEIQEEYAEILQNYTLFRFPEDKTLFARVVMKLTDLRNINEVHTKMLLKMKLDDIEPLLLEIFDLPS
ncbi:nuclear hormone receptor HR96 [Patella vulgata]|uniref:nuclear hormone receptor HR96 n=1 Tax=Patella vulgata TaxID=6465 RepID=UPI00217F4522|nr:nuclear hormone receptor HR96 [Patella vulgata]